MEYFIDPWRLDWYVAILKSNSIPTPPLNTLVGRYIYIYLFINQCIGIQYDLLLVNI